jgi:L-ascorbate metabolism protein UlaG (beta-lactamase superfamily)
MVGPAIPPAPAVPDWRKWTETGLHAAWLGHSTVLLKVGGVTVLTDPIFSRRCGIGIGPVTVGLKRLVAPALALRQLPKIDLILLSHAHFDHFDLKSLRRLEGRGTAVVTARRTSDLLRAERYAKVIELGWGEETRVGAARVRAIEVNHWGARMRTDTWRGYNGYVIESGKYRVLFGGDTARTDAFREVRAMGPVDLAILPIGAYNPWIRYHCTPEQAWRMANDAGSETILPVHHQTFALGREPYYEPIERLLEAEGNRGGVVVKRVGEEFAGG